MNIINFIIRFPDESSCITPATTWDETLQTCFQDVPQAPCGDVVTG